MHGFFRRHVVLPFIAAAALAGLAPAPAAAETLAAGDGLKWYRGNMHTHSHWSDGNDYLEMIALWYRDNGYQFLVFTDHNVLADSERWINIEKSKGGRAAFDELKATFPDLVNERTNEAGEVEVRLRTFAEVSEQFNKPGEFLLIQGEEISDRHERLPIHLNASNILELIPPIGGRSVYEVIQNNIRAVMDQRERTGQPMIVHLNHPNFGFAITAEDIMQIRGDRFFEVYNGHPSVHNSGDEHHAGTERVWDIVLTRRLAELNLPVMYGLAVDDGHNYHNIPTRGADPGRGWVNVLSGELSAAALIEALEAGRFYSSSGVELRRVSSTEKGLAVEVEPVEGETYTIEFLGTRKGYDPASEPVLDSDGKEVRATRRYSDDVGEILATVQGTKASYEFTGDEIYVRARVTSSAEHPNPSEPGEPQRAWCQPVVGPGAAQRHD
jgi:hypothetical protein